MRAQARSMLRRAGLEDRAVAVKRAFEPAIQTRVREDERHLVAILAAVLAPDSCCVDIGANIGGVLEQIVRIAPEGRHVAFEPLPQLAADLERRLPGVDVRAVALSDEPGTLPFQHVIDRPGWSGLRHRDYPSGDRVEEIRVPVARLDDALEPGYAPELIKIDVEGAELGVLRGAERTLREHRPLVVFEHGLGAADVFGTRPEQVHALLTGHGYRIFGLDGTGPFGEAEFAHCFDDNSRVDFLARP